MTVKVAYVTTARSDYGPAYWLIHDLFHDKTFDVALLAGGSHLDERHGLTVSEIERDGWPIRERVPFFLKDGADPNYARAAAHALKEFGRIFAEQQPDLVLVYGDRHELLPICTAAVLTRTPIAHVCGGDVTEGAIDEQVRHAVTKMAHVHFPSTPRSAQRVLAMGEEPWRVHVVGDPALDHFVRGASASVEELTDMLGFRPDRETLLITFHPTTLEAEDTPRQVGELAAALREYPRWVVLTGSAPDPYSSAIREAWEELVRERPRTRFVDHLGSYRYRGLLYQVGVMVGNSSSGLNEAPCVPLPVVNIGRRQQGRERAANVLNVPPERDAICLALRQALTPAFRESLRGVVSPYGKGEAARQMVEILRKLPSRSRLLHKRFHEARPETSAGP